MEDQDKTFMKLAIDQARISIKQGDVPFGAVIIQNGIVIVSACNSEQIDNDVTKHAELKAVSEACRLLGRRDLSDCTIYSSVEPCPMCVGAIFHACIKRVVCGMSRDDLPHLFRTRNIRLMHLAEDWHYTPEVEEGVLREQAVHTFLQFKKPFRVIPKDESVAK